MLSLEHWRLTSLDHVLGPSHRGRRIEGHDLADDQVIKEHANCCEVLLYSRHGSRMLSNVGSHQDGLDLVECDVMILAPGKETRYRTEHRQSA